MNTVSDNDYFYNILTTFNKWTLIIILIGVLLKLVNLKSEMFIDVPVPSQEVRFTLPEHLSSSPVFRRVCVAI
jgi:cytochrome c biogenesis protein ResB